MQKVTKGIQIAGMYSVNTYHCFLVHVFFCDKEGVFCIFVIVCTFLFVTQTVYCPVNKGVSFTETQTNCRMQAAVDATLAQDEESVQNHHKSPLRTQTDGYNCCKLEKENPIFALRASRNASV